MASAPQDHMPGLLAQLQQVKGPAALELLMKASDEHPRDPRPLLLLAAEEIHADHVDRAEAAYLLALQRAPGLAIARFQLGLLQFTCGRPAAALATWAPLEGLPEGDPLRTFPRAFAALAHERYEEARDLFLAGIAANKTNEPLSRDMQKVIDQMRASGLLRDVPAPAAPAPAADATPAAPAPSADTGSQGHFLVTGYGRKV